MTRTQTATMTRRLYRTLACALLSLLLLSCSGDTAKEQAEQKRTQEAAQPRGNIREDSFQDAKRTLGKEIYHDHRVTLYCGADYDAQGNVTHPAGFRVAKHRERAGRIEWEHVVPAENFGRTFSEWRDGHPDCQDRRGAYKGRKCADRVSREYRLMQADMYNLYPAIGAVNALRQNYSFTLLPGAKSSFGSCGMKIEGNKAEPPEAARGVIARTYKYMSWAYPRYKMSSQQEQLMDAWDRMHPVDQWECLRARRIETVQGNENPVVKGQCRQAGLWQ